MQHGTIVAGFGGQGILFCSSVLAQAALLEGREVSWMPSYGPEMRGGTASCTVIVADRPIGSPTLDAADSAIVLNPPSLAKFEPLVAHGGLIVINSSLVEAQVTRTDIEALLVPCTQIARDAGDDRLVSIVALGGLIARRPIVERASVEAAIRELLGRKKAHMIDADIAAFELGHAAGMSGSAREQDERVLAEVWR
ncbi:MAG TPA: 2-oxoacid:acceptor oxidoreductase family protein [Candidatus Limnocylindrales bacterium]|jgi:2-oxoglutarate ferredoxin oxidoreductase subunit gamma